MNVSNKQFKKSIKAAIVNKLNIEHQIYKSRKEKLSITISLFNTTPSNTFPAYSKNIGNKVITVHIGNKFILAQHVSKEDICTYDEKTISHYVASQFIKSYKQRIIEEAAQEDLDNE